MVTRLHKFLIATLLFSLAAPAITIADEHRGSAETPAKWLSESGAYTVSFTSSVQPIEINRIHEWIVHIETEEGDPVENAEITIEGGMPAHNHGMPTAPRVTEYLGDGDYRAKGLRFHMQGQWQITIGIDDGSVSDSVIINLQL